VDVTSKDIWDRTGFYFACEKLYDTSPHLVVEIGGLICKHRNIQPSELLNSTAMPSDPLMIDNIKRSISRNQQKSARK